MRREMFELSWKESGMKRSLLVATVVAGLGSVSWGSFPVAKLPVPPQHTLAIVSPGAHLSIDGGVVVWEASPLESPISSGEWDLYGFELQAWAEIAVSTAPGSQAFPDLSGNIAVWTDYRNDPTDPSDIYGLYLDSGVEFPISTAPGRQFDPAIWGSTVVWQDNRDGVHRDLYSYDLTTAKESRLTTNAMAYELNMDRNIIVYSDYRSSGDFRLTDIYGYDLTTGTEFPIATGPAPQIKPVISGNTVVYYEGDDTVKGYDLSTGETFTIWTGLLNPKTYPGISGDQVVWGGYTPGPEPELIRGADLTKGVDFVVNDSVPGNVRFAIEGNLVVFGPMIYSDMWITKIPEPATGILIAPLGLWAARKRRRG